MNLTVNWSNPYEDRSGEWLKGNLHTHTSPASGCGTLPVEQVLDIYASKEYDFLAISDHMSHVEPEDDRLVFIQGIEWNSPAGEHTGVYSMNKADITAALELHSHAELLPAMAETDALLILNHPNWQIRPHYRREELLERPHYHGIEIYNGVIERLAGYAIATDKWDYLLYNGRRVLGFASDDSHNETDIGIGWNVVRAKERTPEAIMQAMISGNFYCSSGVTIREIRKKGSVIEIESEDAQEIQVRGNGGRWIKRVCGSGISFDTAGVNSPYVRFTLFGEGASMAWTQPFFLE